MRVALTGGSGVVGAALLQKLIAAGHQVTALARSAGSAEILASSGAKVVHGDVLDEPSLQALVDGAEWVFHVAGVNEMCSLHPDMMYRVNVEGSLNVLRASRRTGVVRMVHTSSASTLGERTGDTGSETTVHRGSYLSHYESSKHAAEIALIRAMEDGEPGEMELVMVNPASVQGPGRATGTAELIIDVINHRLRYLVDTTLSLVDIDDCADGHLLAAAKGAPGQRYVLSGATVTVREAVGLYSEIAGSSPSVRYLPPALASTGALLTEAMYRMIGRRPPLCREMVRVMRAGASYDGTRAVRELGLRYTPLDQTIRRSVSWFRSQGLISG